MRSAFGISMARNAPYLQRRGFGLYFRIGVPHDLRHVVDAQEITKTLSTADKRHAGPLALECAAVAKRLFHDLRTAMNAPDSENGPSALLGVLRKAQDRMNLLAVKKAHEDEVDELLAEHRRALDQAKLEVENRTLRQVLTGLPGKTPVSDAPRIESVKSVVVGPSVPMLKEVIDGFLGKYEKANRPQMLKKHRPVLTMLLDLIGNKPVNELRQADINDFFSILSRLPPRWKDECRMKGLTIRELAAQDHAKTLGPKSIEDTYIASLRPFLIAAKRDWMDQGFPPLLTTDGAGYEGKEKAGTQKQRAFKLDELKKLFSGPEMAEFASSTSLAHFYWLPHIGLFTGARVNEICQLNPQVDILRDPETGTWHFLITEETEADVGIVKSVKSRNTRQVPIHSKLIDLGLLDYVSSVKAAGAKRLFPAWEMTNRRASGIAEKWFRQFLRDTGLRDETASARIVGMHAFRHTLLTYGAMQKPPLSLLSITGHSHGDLPIDATGASRGYLTVSMLGSLAEKANLLNKLDYPIEFVKPVKAG